MIIQGEDFIFTPVKGTLFFDVDLLQTINKGKENERKEFKNAAYGVTLEYAIELTSNYRIENNAGDSVLSLQEYLKQKKEIVELISNLCHGKE